VERERQGAQGPGACAGHVLEDVRGDGALGGEGQVVRGRAQEGRARVVGRVPAPEFGDVGVAVVEGRGEGASRLRAR
jgi:hypothetical protein